MSNPRAPKRRRLSGKDECPFDGNRSSQTLISSAPTPLTRQALEDLREQYRATSQHRLHRFQNLGKTAPNGARTSLSHQELQRLARQGGPDLSDIRGVSAQSLRLVLANRFFSSLDTVREG